MTPRDQQWDGADAVAAHAAAGGRVFLLGDDPGVGKTGTAILAARLIAEQRDVRSVLVVADRPAAITIPHWARSIAGFGDGGLRWCVTTWDRLAKVAQAAVRPGRSPTRRTWSGTRRPSGGSTGRRSPAPAGSRTRRTCWPARRPPRTPRWSCPTWRRSSPSRHGESLREWADLPKQLTAHGFHVERGRYGWQWTEDADERRADLGRLQGWLADADPPATLHRPAPWGPVSVTGTPVALTPAERAAYDSEWSEFRAEMQLARRVAAEREGPGGAAAVPAEGRADPGAGDGRLGEGAGGGRAAGRGVGRVRRDGGRSDPRGAAGRRHPGGRHLRPRPVRRRGRAAALPARRGDGLRVHRDRLDQPARRRAAARRPPASGDCRGSGCSTSRGSPASRPGRSPAARTATAQSRRGGSPSPRTPSRSRSPA